MSNTDFTEEQKRYLEGFAAGSGIARSLVQLPVLSNGASMATVPQAPVPSGPVDPNRAAQDRAIAEGKKLVPEEMAKHAIGHGLDIWDKVMQHAREGRFPKGTDVFLFKFQGMFYVAPAQDSFMCRLRLAGGLLPTYQLRGVADLAERFGGGYSDITTRANLQLRNIAPQHTADVLISLHDLGIVNRGAGSDNIRNVTCSPTAGVDPQELIDTRPLAKQLNHYILNHREMYGLPRKFNIAFDGGGTISALEDTNDIGFTAVRTPENTVAFRLSLGGITGHGDFARDTGVLVTEADCITVSAAIVKAFIEHGDRTDRKKARLKYVLDRMGFDGFLKEVEKHLPTGVALRRVPLEECGLPSPADKHAHVGFHAQKQAGHVYCGVVLPVGRMTVSQMRGLANLADRFGSGELRLTVWQNLLIPNVRRDDMDLLKQELEVLDLHWSASHVRAGLVACTGAAGCKFGNADTKLNAMQIANYLEAQNLVLDQPLNIHITGCHHSCAQHYIGDIGLVATKTEIGEEMVEAYHIHAGGGYGMAGERGIAKELYRNVIAAEAPKTIETILRGYLANRKDGESFNAFVRSYPPAELNAMFDEMLVVA